MSLSINANNTFYKGKEEVSEYGNSSLKRDEMAVYEYNTIGENGNEILDKLTKEETIKTLNKIGNQYEENVIVSISGDGLAALTENKYTRSNEIQKDTEKQKAESASKNKRFQSEIEGVNFSVSEKELDFLD